MIEVERKAWFVGAASLLVAAPKGEKMNDITFNVVLDCTFLSGMLFGLYRVCFRWAHFRARYGTLDLYFWLVAFSIIWGVVSTFAAVVVSSLWTFT